MNILAVLLLIISTVTANMPDPKKSVNLNNLLHFEKPKSKSDLNYKDQKHMLLNHIQTLASKSCNLFKEKQHKEYKFFECLHNDNPNQEAVADHLFQWTALDKEKRDCVIINEIRIPV